MDKQHKEILISQRANLVENINIRDGLFTQLIAKKVLTQRMVRSIQTGRSLDEQIEALLDRLPQCGSKAFDLFCEALNEDFQEETVNLYLRPDNPETNKHDINADKHDDKASSVQESSSASTISEDSVSDNGQAVVSQAQTAPCQVGREEVSLGETSGLGTSLGLTSGPGTITEEYQQQIYRRSIEPGLGDTVPGLDGKTGLDQHDARYLYQNILANPGLVSNSVYSMLSSPAVSLADKERLLAELSPCKTAAFRAEVYSNNSDLNVKDSSYSKEHLMSSPLLRSFQAELSSLPLKSLHHLPSDKLRYNPDSQSSSSCFVTSSLVGPKNCNVKSDWPDNHSSSQSPLKSQPAPFSFQTLERQPVTLHSSPDKRGLNPEIHSSPVLHSSIRHSDREPSVLASLSQQERVKMAANSPLMEVTKPPPQGGGFVTSMSGELALRGDYSESIPSTQHHTITRDIREIPRHIQVEVPLGADARREMISLPRHVEMAHPGGGFVTGISEELVTRGDYHNNQSLKRNDSVDTMNKRPFTEIQEPDAKRFRENIENIPSTPEKLTSLKLLETNSNHPIVIPVIDEAKKLPSHPSVVIETDRHVEMTQKGSLLGVMDDPEIDLTDGPVNVKVDHCSRQFYLTYYKQAYKMRSIPRGKALIMNVNEVVGKSARRGTDIDRDNLHNLLCQLHFDVTVYNDDDGLTAKEMVLKLQDFSQDAGHGAGDCAVVCILSHGEEGYIFGADGKKFELDAVFSLFDNTCCQHLRGKPKLFIIQACRGGALDRGVQYYPDEHDGSDARVRQVPSMSDMLICYPTQNGYYAWRNRDRGSWYVEALVHVFMKYSKCEDVCTMLNRVNLLVSKKVSHCPTVEMDQMSQMSEYKSTLRMPHFFFFPGIGGT